MMWCDRPRLPDLAALAVQMNRDEGALRRDLRQRDRALAVNHGLDIAAMSDRRRLRGWLHHVDGGAAYSRAWAGWLALCLLGGAAAVLLGVVAALALFRYDGTRPVNVLAVLIVFVALPVLTAVLSLVGMAGWLPGSAALRALSPAGLLWSVMRKLPGAVGQTAEQLRGELRRGGKLMGGAGRWAAWSFSQMLGLLFVAAGFVTFLVLLATTDLAFGWASTLDLDPGRLQRWLAALLWFHPGVAPDVAMIQQTITERAEPFAARYAESPEMFKAWWRPLVWLIVAYALLPRLVLAVIAAWCSSRATARAFDRYPGNDEVVRRIKTPVIDAHGDQRDPLQGDHTGAVPRPDGDDASPQDLPRHGPVICWSSAPTPGVEVASDIRHAGGGSSLEQDQTASERAAEGAEPIRIFVKAWEPPLAEFTDFLTAMRHRIGEGRMLYVAAVTRGPHDAAAADVWQRKLASLGDPWMRVASVTASPDAGAVETRGPNSNGGAA